MENVRDNRLSIDEARRIQQHESMRGELEANVDRVISAEAKVGLSDDPRIEQVASNLRQKTISEVEETERDLTTLRRAARFNQVVDYTFYVIYALLGLRFLLGVIGANGNAGFVQLVRGITEPLFAPFRNIVGSPALMGNASVLPLPILIAILVYGMLQMAIRGLLRLMAERRTTI